MKKIFLILSLFFVLSSCEIDQESVSVVTLPVESVVIPTEFELGGTYPIIMRYYRPSSCHTPYGIYYEKDLNIRVCAVNNIVREGGNCNELNDYLVEETFDFTVTSTGNYIFKFWTGVDSEGNNTFLEYDIPVN
ncbi:hypothetical protein [Flavobacterium cheniae]|jgi:hypothetical protein|uniref:Lipoprotein n=1 Tax=Flavobacterium cheniae TaxID=295428 RepID=A0A562KH77_9FLAO|nr:hypothetical protein [Flavobacterium cheniae]TDR24495.1 hypothetical protein C8D80_1536 [Flavobacterium cheniae]TWH94750.1 hypothetical protein IP97_01462 [Flavobacterium cheniae]